MGDLSQNLSTSEFICKCGCGQDIINDQLVHVLQDTVDYFTSTMCTSSDRVQILIHSGNRCNRHNLVEGGSPRSRHIKGQAADFALYYVQPAVESTFGYETKMIVNPGRVAEHLESKFPTNCGIGYYHGRTHFDVSQSGRRRWDMRGANVHGKHCYSVIS